MVSGGGSSVLHEDGEGGGEASAEGDHGFRILPSGDDGAVALVLGSTSRREELRQAGVVRAGEFSWERMAEETAEIYRRARGAITHAKGFKM